MTRPTPLPLRVGAKQKTCSGPSWRTSGPRRAARVRVVPAESMVVRNSASFVWQRTTPAIAQEARALHLRGRRPARAAVGVATGCGLAAQGRHRGRAGTGQGRGGGDGARVAKEDRGVGPVEPGPDDPLPRSVKALLSERRPGGPERGRVREAPRDVLGGEPASAHGQHHQGRDRQEPHPLLHARRRRLSRPVSRPSQRTQVAATTVNRAGERICPHSMARESPGDLLKLSATIGEGGKANARIFADPRRRRRATGGVINSANPPRTPRAICCVKNELACRFLARGRPTPRIPVRPARASHSGPSQEPLDVDFPRNTLLSRAEARGGSTALDSGGRLP